jgi:hypothetical protein
MSGIAIHLRLILAFIACCVLSTSCGAPAGDAELTSNTRAILMDWHISGFWVVNSPVAWVRVINLNSVPIKNVTIEYTTYDAANVKLDTGRYEFEGTVAPGQTKNFTEQYLGLVSLYTERLSVRLLSVERD